MESTREQVKNLALDPASYGSTSLSTVTHSCKINVGINTVTDPEDWFILRKLSLQLAEELAEMTRLHGFSSLHKLLVLAKGIIN